MTGRIRVLSDSVANQIAAGEVVERPASVVKELVENALDAACSQVEILLEAGGRRRIRVADDGVGMSRRDAVLALERHATSKIAAAADLTSVETLGFRGEALPSIAAVSRLIIDTRSADEDTGTRVAANGGMIASVADRARTPGTTVEIRDLFFNAPARAKFLKPSATEVRVAAEAVTSLALANPGKRFSLRSGPRSLVDLPATDDLRQRIADLWGSESASTLVALRLEADGYLVSGLVQRPDAAVASPRRSSLAVDGRPVKDPRLTLAAERGYLTTIPAGVRPWIFLRVAVPSGEVDVNVHPAKAEVRFRDMTRVEELVETAVRGALGTEESSATLAQDGRVGPGSAGRHRTPDLRSLAASEVHARPGAGAAVRDDLRGRRTYQGTLLAASGAPRPVRMWQALNTYILAEVKDGILVVDQHSAHERVLFHRLMKAFRGSGEGSQRLLFPTRVTLTKAELDQVVQVRGILAKAGFDVDVFGPDEALLRAAPNPHPYFDAERAFREMVAELAAGSELTRSARNQHERIAMTFACKSAIRSGQPLSDREMQELFDQLFATDLPHHDVHGRPTIIRLPASELARRFGR